MNDLMDRGGYAIILVVLVAWLAVAWAALLGLL